MKLTALVTVVALTSSLLAAPGEHTGPAGSGSPTHVASITLCNKNKPRPVESPLWLPLAAQCRADDQFVSPATSLE
jgi:hypothetical protein